MTFGGKKLHLVTVLYCYNVGIICQWETGLGPGKKSFCISKMNRNKFLYVILFFYETLQNLILFTI